jgi:glutaredoxin
MSFARTMMAAGLLGLATLWSLAANAQQVYRIVGPDGRVTFTDRPPVEGKGTAAPSMSMQGGDTSAALPFELRTTASRYPVTIYTRPGCAPCDAGRVFLESRGIPFSERTVTSDEDADALQRLSGGLTLPFATIGGQQLRGFSEVEWGQFLDAAGYPKTSQLPSAYRRPPATPLVAATTPQPAAAQERRPQRAAAPAPAPSASPSNPAGIQF